MELVKQKISKKIKRFELMSLIQALESIGYGLDDIFFKSHSSLVSAGSLFDSISFSERAPRVTVCINMGLLGINSSLPSYFRNYMDTDEIDAEKFTRYLEFFSHHQIMDFVKTVIPERNRGLFNDWKRTHFHYLSLLGFESVSTLWLIIKGCFPELVVDIKKNARMMKFDDASLKLGRDTIGEHSYIGERMEQTLSSFKITFTTQEEVSELGKPWPIEIKERLMDWVFPLIEKTDLHLSIVIVIKNKYGHIHLGENNFLGYDRVGKNKEPFQLLLFYGYMRDLGVATN